MTDEAHDRLDKVLVLRGIISSRTRAQALIKEGKVSVNGGVVTESDHPVRENDAVLLAGPDHPWVSRGGLKLDHALRHFRIDPRGKVTLDIGAGTGGFTDVLLAHGAAKVYALDVGHDQLVDKIKNDPRVVNMEGMHVNAVHKADFAEPIDLAVIDVSFISLTKILPKVHELLSPEGVVIALVKPQFEVGRENVGKGVIKDDMLHVRVIHDVTECAKALGFIVSTAVDSPILGGDGNKEFLLLLEMSK